MSEDVWKSPTLSAVKARAQRVTVSQFSGSPPSTASSKDVRKKFVPKPTSVATVGLPTLGKMKVYENVALIFDPRRDSKLKPAYYLQGDQGTI